MAIIIARYVFTTEAAIDELRGKAAEEVFEILDQRTDKVLEKERAQVNATR